MRSLALALATLIIAIGCASRQLSYTYIKHGVSQQALLEHQRILEHTAGVEKVIPYLDAEGTARIQVYVKESTKEPGQVRALDLGYARQFN